MTLELKMLALSIVLGLVQIVLASHAASLQRGYVWTASSRDEAVPALTGVAGRLQRALQNFVETFPLFAAAVLTAHAAATHSWMTEWGVVKTRDTVRLHEFNPGVTRREPVSSDSNRHLLVLGFSPAGCALPLAARFIMALGFVMDGAARSRQMPLDPSDKDWTEDPESFERASQAARTLLTAARPQGTPPKPTSSYLGWAFAIDFMEAMRGHKPDYAAVEQAADIKRLLGPIAERMSPEYDRANPNASPRFRTG
jgi:hypothetical protein